MDDQGVTGEPESGGTPSQEEPTAVTSDPGQAFSWEPAPYPLEPEAVTAASGSRRWKQGSLLGAAIIMIAVGIGAVVAHSSKPRSLQATVAASVNQAISSKTADLSLTTNVEYEGRPITASGTGVIDFTAGTMSAHFSVTVGSQSEQLSLEYVGGSIYEQVPDLGLIAPGKTWISLDLSGIAGSSTGALAGGGNPTAMLALLAQRGATVTAIPGTTTVEGVPTRAYRVVITPAMVQKELANSALPSWLRQGAQKIDFSAENTTVYIDHHNLLRRYDIDTQVTTAGQALSIDETLDLSNYGTSAADVTAPPASETVDYQQFLQDLQSAESSSQN